MSIGPRKQEYTKEAVRFAILLLRKKEFKTNFQANRTLSNLFKRACRKEGISMCNKIAELMLGYVFEKGVLTREDIATVTYEDGIRQAIEEKEKKKLSWQHIEKRIAELVDVEFGTTPHEDGENGSR